MYFVIVNRLLKDFEKINIGHIPRVENQVANDLEHIASGYKISKEKLQQVIEVRGRVTLTMLSPTDLKTTKLGYVDHKNFERLEKAYSGLFAKSRSFDRTKDKVQGTELYPNGKRVI